MNSQLTNGTYSNARTSIVRGWDCTCCSQWCYGVRSAWGGCRHRR